MWGGFEPELVELYLLLVSLHGIQYWSYSVFFLLSKAREWGVSCEQASPQRSDGAAAPPGGSALTAAPAAWSRMPLAVR